MDAGQPCGIPGCLEQPVPALRLERPLNIGQNQSSPPLSPVSLFSLFSLSSFSLSKDPSTQSPGRGRFRGLTLPYEEIPIRTGGNGKQPACFISIYRVHEKRKKKTLTAGSNLRGSSRKLPAPLIKAPVWKHNLCLSSSVI